MWDYENLVQPAELLFGRKGTPVYVPLCRHK